jgi:hypothetical protein
MLRPKVMVLPDSALASAATAKARAKQPTHEVMSRQPYYLARANEVVDGAPADGHLAKNAKVALLRRGAGTLCRVEDAAGRQVTTAFSGLRPLR